MDAKLLLITSLALLSMSAVTSQRYQSSDYDDGAAQRYSAGGASPYSSASSYSSYSKKDEDQYYDPPKYSFDYKVKDDYYNTDFGHSESRDGEYTQGTYHVLLPDGRMQTVTYTVDGGSGYVAEVQYSGDASYDQKDSAYGNGNGKVRYSSRDDSSPRFSQYAGQGTDSLYSRYASSKRDSQYSSGSGRGKDSQYELEEAQGKNSRYAGQGRESQYDQYSSQGRESQYEQYSNQGRDSRYNQLNGQGRDSRYSQLNGQGRESRYSLNSGQSRNSRQRSYAGQGSSSLYLR